jgi:DNA-binding transcriptional regulator/RsmH inhibitor MraZ
MTHVQYQCNGCYLLTVDPRGRITFPKDVSRGLEQKVHATIVGDSDIVVNAYGVQYQQQWVYVSREHTRQRKTIVEIREKIKQEDAEAPEVVYKAALLERKVPIDPAEEARKIVTKLWQYQQGGERVQYMTVHLYLDTVIERIRRQQKSQTELETVTSEIHCSTQSYEIDAQGRICLGKDHGIVQEALQGNRELVLLGMQDMFVFMTPEQREALQKAEPRFIRDHQVIQLVRP